MPGNSTRETDNMIHLPDNYKKTLITSVYSETEEVDGVQILNIIDFLLSI